MKTLFIDTHLNDIYVFLLEDGKTVKKKELINKRNNSEFMFPMITEVIDGEKLDEIFIVNGPGSFTGVRLGVTIAKTLAYTLNIPIKTITSLEVMAVSSGKNKVLIDDNNGYYVGMFDDKYNLLEDYKYVNKSEILDTSDYQIEYIINPEKVYEFLNTRESINPHSVNPIYIKKIGVEIDKESKNN